MLRRLTKYLRLIIPTILIVIATYIHVFAAVDDATHPDAPPCDFGLAGPFSPTLPGAFPPADVIRSFHRSEKGNAKAPFILLEKLPEQGMLGKDIQNEGVMKNIFIRPPSVLPGEVEILAHPNEAKGEIPWNSNPTNSDPAVQTSMVVGPPEGPKILSLAQPNDGKAQKIGRANIIEYFLTLEVYFDIGDHLSEQTKIIQNVTQNIVIQQPHHIVVVGFADETGHTEMNLELSKKRALGVANGIAKIGEGIAKNICYLGLGEDIPSASKMAIMEEVPYEDRRRVDVYFGILTREDTK